jgi:high affinity Mn2+ porin
MTRLDWPAPSTASRTKVSYISPPAVWGIIGNGQLPNAGPEQILEVYYRVPVFSFAHLTLDYQCINHPAYNRDRGPVSIFGLRTRVQF